jgi:cysteinyl-tRNA synthetase
MDIYLYNTLTGGRDLFTPIKSGKVSMYHCGPTVYGYAHIGNLRAYLFADTVRRMFEYNNFKVNQVLNITDIGHLANDTDDGEDKMTKALLAAGKPLTLDALKEHADFYTEQYLHDLTELNIQKPHHLPKASEHIKEDISLIKNLEKKGFAYVISSGVYFDTTKDEDYGKLGKVSMTSDDDAQSRIGVNSEKRNPKDFCLWKFDDSIGWESPWGQGFPGWHIECSAMSMKYLGETFDIHTGGIDHIPVHHNNEIAQSESATGKPFSHFWMHGAFVNIDGGKIAKSVGNTYYLKDLVSKDISPLAYRYWILTAHYRTLVNFTEESVRGAQTAYERLKAAVRELGSENGGTIDIGYQAVFHEAINDDLNTAKALATTWELIKDTEVTKENKRATILDFDRVLGLKLKEASEEVREQISEEVMLLLEQRNEARKVNDWKASDDIRAEIESKGYEVKDTDTGTKVIPKR